MEVVTIKAGRSETVQHKDFHPTKWWQETEASISEGDNIAEAFNSLHEINRLRIAEQRVKDGFQELRQTSTKTSNGFMTHEGTEHKGQPPQDAKPVSTKDKVPVPLDRYEGFVPGLIKQFNLDIKSPRKKIYLGALRKKNKIPYTDWCILLQYLNKESLLTAEERQQLMNSKMLVDGEVLWRV